MKQSNEFNPLIGLILVASYIADVFILVRYDGEFDLFALILWIIVIAPPLFAGCMGIALIHKRLKERDLAYARSKEKGGNGPEEDLSGQGDDSREALKKDTATAQPVVKKATEDECARSEASAAQDSMQYPGLRKPVFLFCRLGDAANLNHTADPEFHRLADLCACGEAAAMWDLGNWFDAWAQEKHASSFYRRAANHWRCRAQSCGHTPAAEWYVAAVARSHGYPLDTALSESDDPSGLFRRSIPGKLLIDLGYGFFEPEREYELMWSEKNGVIEAASFANYQAADADGFGGYYYEDRWFLDENMQPIPGMEKLRCPMNDPCFEPLLSARSKAAEIVGKREDKATNYSPPSSNAESNMKRS